LYVEQWSRSTATRHKEHTPYIRTNNPNSAYALHILNNRHEYGTADKTLKLLISCNKETKVNCWELFYMQAFRREDEWQKSSIGVGSTCHITTYTFSDSVCSRTVRHTHINNGKYC
jgi:hypothetical protein